MTIESLEAWLISKKDSGDTSVRAHFFTRSMGLISVLYKGGKQPKKHGFLQPFTPLWVSVRNRQGWYYVQTLEHRGQSLLLEHTQLFCAMYVNELLDLVLRFEEAHPELYDAYLLCLSALAKAKDKYDIENCLRHFEASFLSACGYQIDMRSDAQGMPIQSGLRYAYVVDLGFVPSTQGIWGKYMLEFSHGKILDKEGYKAIKWVMRKAIDSLLEGRPVKSRQLFKSVN